MRNRQSLPGQWFNMEWPGDGLFTSPCLGANKLDLNSVVSETWFYEDGLKVTMEQTVAVVIDPAAAPICGEKGIAQLVTCILPPGHECKHFPFPQQIMEQGEWAPVTGIRIERVNA